MLQIGQRARVVQLCSLGVDRETCEKYLNQKGTVVGINNSFAEGQNLLHLDSTEEEVWFFSAELCKIT